MVFTWCTVSVFCVFVSSELSSDWSIDWLIDWIAVELDVMIALFHFFTGIRLSGVWDVQGGRRSRGQNAREGTAGSDHSSNVGFCQEQPQMKGKTQWISLHRVLCSDILTPFFTIRHFSLWKPASRSINIVFVDPNSTYDLDFWVLLVSARSHLSIRRPSFCFPGHWQSAFVFSICHDLFFPWDNIIGLLHLEFSDLTVENGK